jgi:hypothetical protein
MRAIESIPVSDLKLDLQNVRFGHDYAESQIEAISLMMEGDSGQKILNLAKHISENGLDPTELQLVYKDSGSYTVIEGNRRLTAMKLLLNPDACPVEKLTSKFRQLSQNTDIAALSIIVCGLVSNREEGEKWLELKHTGENSGAGRVVWSGDIRDEFRARMSGTPSIGKQVRELVEGSDFVADDCKALVAKINVTNLTRFFSSGPAQQFFRLKVINKELTPEMDIKLIFPAIEYFLFDFYDQGNSVKLIYDDLDRKNFIKRIPDELNPSLAFKKQVSGDQAQSTKPEDNSQSDAPHKDTSSKNDKRSGQGPGSTNTDEKKPKKIRTRPPATSRKYLIDYSLNISDKRINSVFRELKMSLVVDDCPNATASLFRVFLELSAIHFIENATGPVLREDNNRPIETDFAKSNLSTKLLAVIKFLETHRKIKKGQASALRKRVNGKDSLGSADYFNNVMHSNISMPISNELKLIADDYRLLLEMMWD